jgi:hypothetical protein
VYGEVEGYLSLIGSTLSQMERAELWYRAEGGYRGQVSGDSVWGMVAVVLRGQRYDFLSYGVMEKTIMRGCGD